MKPCFKCTFSYSKIGRFRKKQFLCDECVIRNSLFLILKFVGFEKSVPLWRMRYLQVRHFSARFCCSLQLFVFSLFLNFLLINTRYISLSYVSKASSLIKHSHVSKFVLIGITEPEASRIFSTVTNVVRC